MPASLSVRSRTPSARIQDVAKELHSVAIHLLRTVRKADAASGLTPQRLSAMSVVVFGSATTLKELAAAEQVSPPTMTRIVQALERDGLLTRVTSPDDRRAVHLAPTAKGRRLLKQGQLRRLHLVEAMLEQLSATEFRSLSSAVPALQRVLMRVLMDELTATVKQKGHAK